MLNQFFTGVRTYGSQQTKWSPGFFDLLLRNGKKSELILSSEKTISSRHSSDNSRKSLEFIKYIIRMSNI